MRVRLFKTTSMTLGKLLTAPLFFIPMEKADLIHQPLLPLRTCIYCLRSLPNSYFLTCSNPCSQVCENCNAQVEHYNLYWRRKGAMMRSKPMECGVSCSVLRSLSSHISFKTHLEFRTPDRVYSAGIEGTWQVNLW